MDKRTGSAHTAPRKAPASQAAHKAKTNAARRKKEKYNPLPLIVLGGLLFVLLCWLLQYKIFNKPADNGNQNGESVTLIDSANTVRITEVMSSNSSIIQDDTGDYADWIEITNVSSSDVDLQGWKLADSANSVTNYFEFPHHVLKSGERTIVFCTSTNRNIYGYTYHAPFKISASGDTLILFNNYDSAVQTLTVPPMTANTSYAEINGSFEITYEPTPLMENTSANYTQIMSRRTVTDSPIKITEIMAKNASYAPDENGEYVDWVEIYNSSSYSISLLDYALTDSELNLRKWTFPNISIGAGEYMLIYCSGYDRRDTRNPLHTSFRLSTEKEYVILTDANGNVIDRVDYDLLKADQSLSKQSDGTWVTTKAPTPGMANTFSSAALISGQFAAQNTSRVFINEVMASTSTALEKSAASYDWVEIQNRSGVSVDLSLWGLSDNPAKPRKWQFPEGTIIPAGSYIGVYLSGLENGKGSYLNANFRLSSSEGETLVLSDPEGRIVDRCPLGVQYSEISYGRIGDTDGFYYLTGATPGTANVATGYQERMSAPVFSVQGGLYDLGSTVTVSLTCEEGAQIYYTLDSSEPDPGETGGHSYRVDPDFTRYISGTTQTYRYTQPIHVNKTTVIRAITVKNGQLTSPVATQTYFMGVSHTMQIVSLVLDPEDLFGYTTGIYVKGPNALAEYPYGSMNRGANFWMDWEKAGNIELYGLDGTTLLSQGCGVKLHGQYSRTEKQKSVKIIARSKYGLNRFYGKLFPNRDYTEYQSFLLRQSGQDHDKSRMRDSILSSLAEGLDVLYQDTALAVVYLNGEYWGQYNMRERINTYSICQWEGWDPAIRDDIDLLKANDTVMKGSKKTWTEFKEWYTKNGIDTEEELAVARTYIDVENYLNYCAVEIYTGNTDLLNCKKYRCAQIDGLWRWVVYDFDWAFYTDTNSVNRWLTPGGVGDGNKCDNSLYIALMKNDYCRNYFLSLMAEKLAGDWSSASVLQKISDRKELLDPELDMHLNKWDISRSTYNNGFNKFVNYAKTRPGRLLYFFRNKLSKNEFEYYFLELTKTIDLIDDKGKSFSYS
ncbi:MAG: lamin tail domain-containing protein [Clostridia bacterium]|nr:lamin tail domain-containing protein [Clostridia bacterium]